MNQEAAPQSPALQTASASAPLARLSASNPPPPTIPDHELLRHIGRGSYGEVWLARNVMGTLRAVKIVHRSTFDHERPYEREYAGIQKFEPISRSHEGFVDILQIGRNDPAGHFYYVMELADSAEGERIDGVMDSWIDGRKPAVHQSTNPPIHHPATYAPQTLRSAIARHGRLAVGECIALGLSLARALAHLHAQGLVHRDIKPSNIIFVGGVPKLADIGLVTGAGAARSYVGTEGFIPPEGPGTPAADLFSLGKVLYEASTGKDRQDFPDPLTNLGEQPDKDRLLELNAVIRRACHPDPRARYQGAEEMLAELELLQRGESVKARRSTRRRIRLFTRIGLAAAALALLLGGGWFVSTNVNWRKPGSTERKATPAQQQEARRLYKQAKTFWRDTRDGFNQGIELLNRAISEDSNFAPAHAELATYYWEAGWLLTPKHRGTEARKNALGALEIDDSLPLAHTILGSVLWDYDWNFKEAETQFRRAIELARQNPHPSVAYTYYSYGLFLASLRRFDEADAVLAEGERIEPNTQLIAVSRCWRYCLDHRFEDVIREATGLLARWPNNTVGLERLAYAHQRLGHPDEALALAQQIHRQDPDPNSLAELGIFQAWAGHREEARKTLEDLRGTGQARPDWGARILAALGEKDQALDQIELGVEQRYLGPLWLVDPLWGDLQSDPRFQALLRKVGLKN